jgi:predicted transcriptional regulator
MLDTLFGSRTRAKLLRLFFANPKEPLYVREICRKLDEHLNAIRRELEHLADLDLVQEEVRDRKKYYSVNTDFVLYPELRALVLKTQVMFQRNFLEAVRSIGSVKLLVLTGVFVGLPDTLTDVLLVGKINRLKLRRLLALLQEHVDRPIRYTLFSTREFTYRNDLTDRFIYHILENKKIVMVNQLAASSLQKNSSPRRAEPNEEKKDQAKA